MISNFHVAHLKGMFSGLHEKGPEGRGQVALGWGSY